MKTWRKLVVANVIVLALVGTMNAGQSWTPLTNQPTFGASNALLLTDGTVMVYDGNGSWSKLTPDKFGSYVNGTWSKPTSLPGGYSPVFFASAVLKDGRMIVMGGEYNQVAGVSTNQGAIYDPLADRWTQVPPPPGWTSIADAQSTTLADGRFMLANAYTREAALLDAEFLTWTIIGAGKADLNAEEGWTLLPDGQVLTVDTHNIGDAELFDPVGGNWHFAGQTPSLLADPSNQEVGPAILRPDGTVFAIGATGNTAIYDTGTGKWFDGPTFPVVGGVVLRIDDGPAALLGNGRVFCGASLGSGHLGAYYFEFDGVNLVEVPGPPHSQSLSLTYTRMLVLPTGQIMYTDGTSDVEIYASNGRISPAWMPTILKVETHLYRNNTYTLLGTQLNGLSAGSEYGDDAQAATNYPLVRITNNSTGRVFYARTANHSSMGVATGSLKVTTQFTVPVKADPGPSRLEVVANGIASAPVSVTVY